MALTLLPPVLFVAAFWVADDLAPIMIAAMAAALLAGLAASAAVVALGFHRRQTRYLFRALALIILGLLFAALAYPALASGRG